MAKQGKGTDAVPAGYDLSAFVMPQRFRWVEADPADLEPAEEQPPLRAEIKVSLTGAEVRAFGQAEIAFDELYRLLAPCVRAWTLTGRAVVAMDDDGNETYAEAPVPPPLVAGPEVFEVVDFEIARWLWARVRNARFERPDGPKATTPADGSGGGPGSATDGGDDAEGDLTAADA